MISVQEATIFARKHFPEGPEKLSEHLSVIIRRGPMDGCDGWCLRTGKRAIIRINGKLQPSRYRFTLAHELGHLILDVPSFLNESYEEMLGSNSEEEKRVNDLASDLLLPVDVVKASVTDLPVVSAALKKLAKEANISELATAIRVCNLAKEIGLINASVALFDGDLVRWQWSKTLEMNSKTALSLLVGCREANPRAFRIKQPDGNVVVASMIENLYFGTATLFVQLLPPSHGMKLSREERRYQLEEKLFSDDDPLRRRVQGCFGAFKKKAEKLPLGVAESTFWEQYRQRYSKTRMNSSAGREYVKLRLLEWCKSA